MRPRSHVPPTAFYARRSQGEASREARNHSGAYRFSIDGPCAANCALCTLLPGSSRRTNRILCFAGPRGHLLMLNTRCCLVAFVVPQTKISAAPFAWFVFCRLYELAPRTQLHDCLTKLHTPAIYSNSFVDVFDFRFPNQRSRPTGKVVYAQAASISGTDAHHSHDLFLYFVKWLTATCLLCKQLCEQNYVVGRSLRAWRKWCDAVFSLGARWFVLSRFCAKSVRETDRPRWLC